MEHSNKWVERKDRGIRGNTFLSSEDRRLVLFVGGATIVKAIGEHRIGFLGPIDAIGMVMMTPCVVNYTASTPVTSEEGVPISLAVDAVLRVRDDDRSIATVAMYAEEKEKVVQTAILHCCQDLCKDVPFLSLHSSVGSLSTSILAKLASSDLIRDSCFEVLQVVVTKLSSNDAELSDALLRKARAEEQRLIAQSCADAALAAAKSKIATDTLFDVAQEDASRRKKHGEYDEAKEKADLLKTLEGRLAVDPINAVRLYEIDSDERRYVIEKENELKIEQARANAKQAEFVEKVYQRFIDLRNNRNEAIAETLVKVMPLLVRGNKSVDLNLTENSAGGNSDADEEKPTDGPGTKAPEDS